jgi:hypothetical protein
MFPLHRLQTRSETHARFFLLNTQALYSGIKESVRESNHTLPSNIQACGKIHELSICLYAMGMN